MFVDIFFTVSHLKSKRNFPLEWITLNVRRSVSDSTKTIHKKWDNLNAVYEWRRRNYCIVCGCRCIKRKKRNSRESTEVAEQEQNWRASDGHRMWVRKKPIKLRKNFNWKKRRLSSDVLLSIFWFNFVEHRMDHDHHQILILFSSTQNLCLHVRFSSSLLRWWKIQFRRV